MQQGVSPYGVEADNLIWCAGRRKSPPAREAEMDRHLGHGIGGQREHQVNQEVPGRRDDCHAHLSVSGEGVDRCCHSRAHVKAAAAAASSSSVCVQPIPPNMKKCVARVVCAVLRCTVCSVLVWQEVGLGGFIFVFE